MNKSADAEISSFLQCIKEKVCERGGKPEDVARFFKASGHRYYEEATNLIASHVVWLTPKTKPKGKSFEVEVSYNPHRIPEKIDAKYSTTIYSRKIKCFFGEETEANCTRVEHIRFLYDRKNSDHPKDIREAAERKGLKSGNLLHAFAIKERAENDPDFKKLILLFLPIYFLGARYRSERILRNQETYNQTVYIGLDLYDKDRFHGGRQEPRVEDPPIIWDHLSARDFVCGRYCAFY